jgi:hypothetical protein
MRNEVRYTLSSAHVAVAAAAASAVVVVAVVVAVAVAVVVAAAVAIAVAVAAVAVAVAVAAAAVVCERKKNQNQINGKTSFIPTMRDAGVQQQVNTAHTRRKVNHTNKQNLEATIKEGVRETHAPRLREFAMHKRIAKN